VLLFLLLIDFVFAFSFALMQKKQKIKDNPIAPPFVRPSHRRAAMTLTNLQSFQFFRAKALYPIKK